MANVIGDIMFPNGKFIKEGEEKTRWMKCGVLMETEKGMRIKLDCMPVGIEPGAGWFSVFEKRDEPPKQQPLATEVKPDGDDQNLPF